jgi:hypothetical protein
VYTQISTRFSEKLFVAPNAASEQLLHTTVRGFREIYKKKSEACKRSIKLTNPRKNIISAYLKSIDLVFENKKQIKNLVRPSP